MQVEAVAGLKLLQLEPLEGFGPPGLGLHGLPFCKIDTMALFVLSHLLLYVSGKTAENSVRVAQPIRL